MIQVNHAVALPHPSAEVFRALADVGSYPHWQPDVLECALASESGLAEGAVVHETRKLMNRRVKSRLAVTRYEPDRALTLESLPGSRPWLRQTYVIEPTGDATCRVELGVELAAGSRMADAILRAHVCQEAEQRFPRLTAFLTLTSRA